MLDGKGNLLMSEKAIQNMANEVFTERLNSNEMESNLIDLEEDTNKLCETRLQLSKLNKSKPWDMEDLKDVLKKIGQDKARDVDGFANELFSLAVAGNDLLEALLRLLN